MKPLTVAEELGRRIIGQPEAVGAIARRIDVWRAGLCMPGKPVGSLLFLGPTGTGKTETVESLAEILHGSRTKLVVINCGEYQQEHEVAKLIGSPPGYLGHRETAARFTPEILRENSSPPGCELTIVLFDEIEKAADSVSRLLLGILDKATLRTGDNRVISFEKTLIFFTSNLGTREMSDELRRPFGFTGPAADKRGSGRLARIGLRAVEKKYSAEFVNRIDEIVTYAPLGPKEMDCILDAMIADFHERVVAGIKAPAFDFVMRPAVRRLLLAEGTSEKYGARELKRTIQRRLVEPLAAMAPAITRGATIEAAPQNGRIVLRFR